MTLLMAHDTYCDGNVCANCCRCVKCQHTIGTRHLDVCACPEGSQHYLCSDCESAMKEEETPEEIAAKIVGLPGAPSEVIEHVIAAAIRRERERAEQVEAERDASVRAAVEQRDAEWSKALGFKVSSPNANSPAFIAREVEAEREQAVREAEARVRGASDLW